MTSTSLTVGLPISRSGQFSRQGKQVLAGVKRWICLANERGGVKLNDGQQVPLELIHYDDESRPAAAERLTQQLLREDEVDILLGPYSSSLTLAAAPIANAHETILWNHSGATDALYDENFQWLISVLAPASRYFHGLLDMVQQSNRSVSRIAICYSSSGSFGRTVASGVTIHARDLDVSVVGEETWKPPLDDATSIIDSLYEVDPQLVLIAGSFEDDIQLVQELVVHDSQATAIGAVAAGISAFGEQLGETAHGVFGPSQWEPNLGYTPDYGPSPADVVDLFKTTSIQATDYPAVQAFATGIVIERCLAAGVAYDFASGAVDQRQLRNTADTLDFRTFYGQFQINAETGKQVGHTPVIVQWQMGKKRVVWPEGHRHVEPLYPAHWNDSL